MDGHHEHRGVRVHVEGCAPSHPSKTCLTFPSSGLGHLGLGQGIPEQPCAAGGVAPVPNPGWAGLRANSWKGPEMRELWLSHIAGRSGASREELCQKRAWPP